MAHSDVDAVRGLLGRLRRPARLLAMGGLALVLLIPLEMVESVVRERYHTHQTVVADIAGAWSADQLLVGPILVVGYTERVEVRDEYVTPTGEKRTTSRWDSRQRRAVVLPDRLEIAGSLTPEERRRGIYRVQVYTADLTISGSYSGLAEAVAALSEPDRLESVDWPGAIIAFGVSDPRGLVSVDGFELNGLPVQPRPGTTLGELVPRGFHLPVGEALADDLELRMPLVLRGSDSLRFLPVGATTTTALGSGWPHPSFVGDVLPASREIGDAGFSAEWTIPLLNRSYPQAWTEGRQVDLHEVEAGVRLFEPVALYDLVTRAVKYGLLFIALTFLTLGLVEQVAGVRMSIVQFLLIGIALALFFLILVALAEHIGFSTAYVMAAVAVVVINSVYCAAILGRSSIAVVVGAVLAAIYGVLYTILKAEDYALLGGTALLVVALVVTMFFTRRVHLAGPETGGGDPAQPDGVSTQNQPRRSPSAKPTASSPG